MTENATRRLLLASLALLLASAARAEGGTITGKVEVTPAKFLAETVVYLKQAPGTHAPKAQVMDQKNMVFVPHVLIVTVGDTVHFLNHDTVVHNVYSADAEGYNLGSFKPGEERTYTFSQAGGYAQLCSAHPEMLGFIFVSPTPYAAVVDKAGAFTIKDVPPGSYQLAVWNSHLKGPDKPVTVAAGQTVTQNMVVKR